MSDRRHYRPIKARHPLVVELCKLVEQHGPYAAVEQRAGVSHAYLTYVRNGRHGNPGLVTTDWLLRAIGFRLAIVRLEEGEK